MTLVLSPQRALATSKDIHSTSPSSTSKESEESPFRTYREYENAISFVKGLGQVVLYYLIETELDSRLREIKRLEQRIDELEREIVGGKIQMDGMEEN